MFFIIMILFLFLKLNKRRVLFILYLSKKKKLTICLFSHLLNECHSYKNLFICLLLSQLFIGKKLSLKNEKKTLDVMKKQKNKFSSCLLI